MRYQIAPLFGLVVGVALALCGSQECAGQTLTASTLAGNGSGHGWFVESDAESGATTVFHVPPRDAGSRLDGAVFRVIELTSQPFRVVGQDARLHVLYPAEREQSRGAADSRDRYVYRMFSLEARASARRAHRAMSWSYVPQGRMDVEPPLLSEAQLEIVGQGPGGLTALLADGSIQTFNGGDWTALPTPDDDRWRGAVKKLLLCDDELLRVLTASDRSSWMWTLSHEEGQQASWQLSPVTEGEGQLPWGRAVPQIGGTWVWAESAPPGIRVRSWDTNVLRTLAVLSDVPSNARFVPLDGSGRLVVTWMEPSREVREISAWTGREMYSGPAITSTPLSADDLEPLAWLLGFALIVVLAGVSGSRSRPAVKLPPGVVPAGAGRRLFAGVVDLLVGFMIADWLSGPETGSAGLLDFAEWISWGTAGLFMALAASIAAAVTGEWLLGQSLGKLMAGCEVVSLRGEQLPANVRRIPALTVTQALVRNTVRWALPPIGVMGLAESDGRHWGDVWAGTIVIVRRPPAPDELDRAPGG